MTFHRFRGCRHSCLWEKSTFFVFTTNVLLLRRRRPKSHSHNGSGNREAEWEEKKAKFALSPSVCVCVRVRASAEREEKAHTRVLSLAPLLSAPSTSSPNRFAFTKQDWVFHTHAHVYTHDHTTHTHTPTYIYIYLYIYIYTCMCTLSAPTRPEVRDLGELRRNYAVPFYVWFIFSSQCEASVTLWAAAGF